MCPRNIARQILLSATVACLSANLPTPGAAQPPDPSARSTPPARTLSAAEADQILQRDWLFQAQGEPLLTRAAEEIGWARQLAQRLDRQRPAPDLASELGELDALEKLLGELQATPAPAPLTATVDSPPNWIWYPEGKPTEDAPAAVRYFRCRFELPADVRAAELRVAADDACEVFVNGRRVGLHETWTQTGVYAVGPLLQTGGNVLAVRAENRPAPSKNPAGLITRLSVTCSGGQPLIRISDGSWRAENELHPQWEQPAFDDSSWKAVVVTAPFGSGPWGKIAGLGADAEDDPIITYAGEAPAVKDLYFSVRQVKRRILLKNPVLDFTQLMFIDQPLPQGPESRHEAIHRMGIMAVLGGGTSSRSHVVMRRGITAATALLQHAIRQLRAASTCQNPASRGLSVFSSICRAVR